TFELSAEEPQPGAAVLPDLASTPFRWPQEIIYDSILFHGPAFRGVERIDACDPHAIRATIHEPDPVLILGQTEGRGLILPVALLDFTGQIIGISVERHNSTAEEVVLTYPNGFDRLEFAPRRDRRRALTGVARVAVEGTRVHADVEMSDDSGRVVLRASGRKEEVVRMPADLYGYWSAPRRAGLSRALPELFRDIPGGADCTVCEAGNAAGRILVNRLWSQVLARMILSTEERRAFSHLNLQPVPTVSWLLGRAVVKDAVRLHLGLDCCLADVVVISDEYGRPVVKAGGRF